MKKADLVAGALTLVAVACNKIEDLANISKDFTYTEVVDVPSITGLPSVIDSLPQGGISADAPVMPMETNSAQYISESGSSANLVQHVKLVKFVTTMKEPSGSNFDFMDTIRVYVSAQGLEEKLAAKKYGIPKGQQTLELDCEDVNLKEYFIKDTMYIRFGGHFTGVPDSNAKIELTPTFNMLANPLKNK